MATLESDGSLVGPFGVMGGMMQPQGHLQVVSALVDDDLDPQAALDRPRFQIQEGEPDGLVMVEDAPDGPLCARPRSPRPPRRRGCGRGPLRVRARAGHPGEGGRGRARGLLGGKRPARRRLRARHVVGGRAYQFFGPIFTFATPVLLSIAWQARQEPR